jgi:ureidoglycolate hydrolase
VDVHVVELTAAAFAPYGEVIEQPARKADAAGNGWQWWGEMTLLPGEDGPYGVGYLNLQPGALSVDWAERHMHSVELIIPVGSDCLIHVGPPDHLQDPSQLPELSRFQVFRVRRGQAVMLRPGVWHGAPLAISEPLVAMVLLRQGTGQIDATVVSFADRQFDIRL